ncbi:hypothetical protein ACKWTF_012322 [Chironomus riparius]
MPSTLESCKTFFGTTDLYAIFEIEKKAPVSEIKKAYYKQALKVHPDRVADEEKEKATESFKILAKVNEVLSDDNKRALYDQQGIVDDDDDEKFGNSWLETFKNLFKPISESDIDNYRKEYVGSELEKNDLKKAYVNGKGCINFIMSHVPFMGVEDEPRFHEIVNEWIKSNEVPEFKAFTDEPKSKRDRRHKKYAREAKEAEKMLDKINEQKNDEDELTKIIAKRQQNRQGGFSSFLDSLAQRYGDNDENDSDELDEESVKKFGRKLQNSQKKRTEKSGKAKKETPVKSGRVTKKK